MAKAILWAYGFDGSPDKVEAEVEAIGQTQFDTVILPFIHVHKPLELSYNDTPLEKLWDGLPEALEKLKTGFAVKKRLLVSVGPFQSDFDAIKEDYAAFVDRLVEFATAHHIDGMDLDYEGGYGAENAKLLALMVNRYRESVPGALLTAAPYTEKDFWTGQKGVLEQARSGSGESSFDWFNVQFYAGSYNTPASEYHGLFDSWATAIGRKGNGVSTPQSFIAPGCNGTNETDGSFKPADLEAGLRSIRQLHPLLGGGFVWNYEGLLETPEAWAQAVVNGCG